MFAGAQNINIITTESSVTLRAPDDTTQSLTPTGTHPNKVISATLDQAGFYTVDGHIGKVLVLVSTYDETYGAAYRGTGLTPVVGQDA